jgi:amidase
MPRCALLANAAWQVIDVHRNAAIAAPMPKCIDTIPKQTRGGAMDLAFNSATQLASLIRRRKIGCEELLDHYVARIERFNGKINAVIWTDLEGARIRARAADRDVKRDVATGPLHGVPMTVKESFDIAGAPSTWGRPDMKNNIAAKDSLAVQRFRDAGVTLFGKTNVPLMLADWQSNNEVYGTTNNPWNLERTPGGSSGGSAAALAAGLTGIEIGSDLGASIRNPAQYCGVYGHKPTWAICSPRGHSLVGRLSQADISVIGPMGRSASDLDIGLKVMAGPDAIDGEGWQLKLPKPRKTRWREFKVAVKLEDPNAEVDQTVKDVLQRLADFLAKNGVKISDTAAPALDTMDIHKVYVALLRADMSSRSSDEQVAKAREAAARYSPDDESFRARMARADIMSYRDWVGWNERRHQMRVKWWEFFQDYDLVICPTASSDAFPHDHVGERFDRYVTVNGKRVLTTDQVFWAGYSGVAYLPSTVAPAGLTPDGLPVGVQIIAPQYHDRLSIHFAKMLEREYRGFVSPPGY